MAEDDADRRALAILPYGVSPGDYPVEVLRAGIADVIREASAANRQLLLDLWRYATGKAWGEISAEGAASDGDTLGDLYARMSAAIGEGKE